MKRFIASFGIAAILVAVTTFAAEELKLDGINCPVTGKPVKADQHLKFKEGEVYFCCDKCPKTFMGKTETFAAKANKQLVETGQYVQTKCPLTGKEIKTNFEEQGSPKIGFCCEKCLAKYTSTIEKERVAMVFGEDPFKKGFELKKAKR